MYDFHVHTNYSNDCSVNMESYITPAIEMGLKGICFTDHVDMDYPGSSIQFNIEYNEYVAAIQVLKEKYKDKLEIFTGVEFGMQPHILEQDINYFKEKAFDYVIGSMHAAKHKELYGGDFLQDKSEHQGILDYFEDMLFCVKNFKNYSNLGHIDAIARYVSKGGFVANRYMEYIEEVLRSIIEAGKGIELNTSGKRYGLQNFHPEPSIIKLYKQLGGQIITLGSDSHKINAIGYGFNEALEALQAYGFKYYTIYRNQKPEFITI